ncbi:hypothetical protein SAMN04487996_108165 [Dyadobacter soli]|uniref:Lipoprotein n=1 Tax=Dyadobacter soli TaxID=659014 RepID=A0A1G7HJ27_9BACT|nr:hypothetical protein [Dyadobacter soli]SDE99999.1 hypothetical protein SAMN04487996_108165 [Dyadobacter soli]
MKYRLILLLVAVFASLLSCNEDVIESAPNSVEKSDDVDVKPFMTDSVDVYIAGAVNLAGDQWRASYWKNDSLYLLDENYSVAHDVVVLNGKVVAAGKYDGKPCLWRDGKRTMLDENRDGEVKAIGVLNGKLYLVGQLYETQTNFRAFIWTEGKMTFLNDFKGYASDIAFSGIDIYVSGMDSERPCYWKNGLKTELSSHFGHGYGIEVIGNDVYVGGEYRPSNGGYFLGGYWKNGSFQSSGNDCYIWNIGVDRGEVFLVGNGVVNTATDVAMLVAGSGKLVLDTPGRGLSGANDIAFSLNNQYVLGTCSGTASGEGAPRVCYWLNNKLHRVTDQKSLGVGIYLKSRK